MNRGGAKGSISKPHREVFRLPNWSQLRGERTGKGACLSVGLNAIQAPKQPGSAPTHTPSLTQEGPPPPHQATSLRQEEVAEQGTVALGTGNQVASLPHAAQLPGNLQGRDDSTQISQNPQWLLATVPSPTPSAAAAGEVVRWGECSVPPFPHPSCTAHVERQTQKDLIHRLHCSALS